MGSAPLSVVLEVPRGASDLWAGFWASDSRFQVVLDRVSVKWLAREEPVAIQPGLVLVEEGDLEEMTRRSGKALLHLVERYDAYRFSCNWVARRWADTQTAAELLAGVLSAPVSAPSDSTRFTGREW
jgi:hypothetical protein